MGFNSGFKGLKALCQFHKLLIPPTKSNGISIKDAVFKQKVSDRPQFYGAIPAISKGTVENYQTWYTRCVTKRLLFQEIS